MLGKIITYIILGLIQGFTEPLPISSSGHLVLAQYLFEAFKFKDLTFEIILNFASFIAIFYIFRKDIIKLISSFFKYCFKKETRKIPEVKNDFKYDLLIVVGSIPAAVGGLLFKDLIESKLSENLTILGISFLITALLLFLVRKINGKKTSKDMTYVDAIIIGLFQMAALMPGISRSGAVLVGCLIVGLTRDDSLKYAFMLYLPVSVGSFVLSIDEMMTIEQSLILPYILGFGVTMVMTYFASLWFFDIVKKGKLWKFSIYLLILGLFVLLLPLLHLV